MRRIRRTPGAAAIFGMLLCACFPGQAAAVLDQVVGAVAPNGGAQLVKHFTVTTGSVIVGFEFVSNDLRTVFPRVALLQGTAKSTSEAKILGEAKNVQAAIKHRIQVALPAITVSGQDLYVAVTLPASNGVGAVHDGPGLGATNLSAPNGSYIASAADGVLQPINVDLAIDLIQQAVAKTAPTGEQAPDGANIPKETFLAGGSPNPATSVAQVQFGLDRRMPVKLAIYNVAGRLMRLLAEGPKDAGIHSVDWDGKDSRGQDLAAGVYIAKLQAGDKVLTQKMVLAK